MTTTEIKEQLDSLQEQINNLVVTLLNYATTDDLTAVTNLINTLLQNTTVLQDSMAELTTKVDKVSTIYGLLDFELDDQNTPLTNGDILQYDNGKWHNISLSSLGVIGGGVSATSLAALSDVVLTSPTNNQALVYNGTSGKWINKEISGGSGDMSDYLTIAMAEATYFKKTGGVVDGSVTINNELIVKGLISGESDLLVQGGMTMYGGV